MNGWSRPKRLRANSNLAARTYLKNGVALQSDVDMIEAELLTAKQQLGVVESSLDYRRMLEIFIGQPLTDKLERPVEKVIHSYTSSRPEFALLEARNRLAAQNWHHSSVRPRLGLFAELLWLSRYGHF